MNGYILRKKSKFYAVNVNFKNNSYWTEYINNALLMRDEDELTTIIETDPLILEDQNTEDIKIQILPLENISFFPEFSQNISA